MSADLAELQAAVCRVLDAFLQEPSWAGRESVRRQINEALLYMAEVERRVRALEEDAAAAVAARTPEDARARLLQICRELVDGSAVRVDLRAALAEAGVPVVLAMVEASALYDLALRRAVDAALPAMLRALATAPRPAS